MKGCSLCIHPQRPEIDAALRAGGSLRAVAGQFSTNKNAVAKHLGHVQMSGQGIPDSLARTDPGAEYSDDKHAREDGPDELSALADVERDARQTLVTIDATLPDLERQRRQLALDVRLGTATTAGLDAVVAEIGAATAARADAALLLEAIGERRAAMAAEQRQVIVGELDRILADLIEQRDTLTAQLAADRLYHADHGVNPAHPEEHECVPPPLFDRADRLRGQVHVLAFDLLAATGQPRYRALLTRVDDPRADQRLAHGVVPAPWRQLLGQIDVKEGVAA